MNLFAAILVAGAVQFCVDDPEHVACRPSPPVVPVAMTDRRIAVVSNLARQIYAGAGG